MATRYDFEDQDKPTLVGEVARITQSAVDAGKSYTVRISKENGWWRAVVTVGDE
jgi:hypothetical protein